ncbi:hypothetical protein B0T24DRAFT_588078 [Lasiosphaeria ovina]|uniref:DUF7689 domain-containing protein n=1 Tax=Lasiosphaeria ovina TaxID=92902 RepID=A0AAE0TXS8_9PEZI|nr:hypothetical protein B0T24DRAFT_588078 [Lasiosphaeria ovina]
MSKLIPVEAAFQTWMSKNFSAVKTALAQNPPSIPYTIVGQPSNVYNCMAYAVNVTDRLVLGHSWKELAQKYANLGYYALTSEQLLAALLQNGDIEVYAKKGGSPLHAHKVWDIYHNQADCQRKTRRYGTIATVYRSGAEKKKAYDDREKLESLITSAGHPARRKDAVFIWSDEPIPERRAQKTMSGRISKNSMPKKKQTKPKLAKAAKE